MGEPEIDFTEPTVSDPCTPFERSDPEPRVEPQPTRIVLLLAEGLEVTPEAPGIFLDSREWAEISARFPELGARSLFYDRGSGHIERVEALAEEGDLEPSLPRLLRFVEVQLPPALGEDAERLAQEIASLPFVSEAYVPSTPGPPPQNTVPTGSRLGDQFYLRPAPRGIDALYAWTQPGGDGTGVEIIDVEWGWWRGHPDMPTFDLVGLGQEYTERSHGTSVVGVLAGLDDGKGVTGIVPGARVRTVSSWSGPPRRWRLEAAITDAIVASSKGDVLLIEEQLDTPRRPVEMETAYRTVIGKATKAGLVVIEPAGNGGLPLENMTSNGKFVLVPSSPDFRDTEAIMVGASTSAQPYAVAIGSNRGERIDCFAAGFQVTTTDGPFPPRWYTSSFSGTSSASAIVAGAAAAVQGGARAAGKRLTSREMRWILSTYSTPPKPGQEHLLGGLPDLGRIFREKAWAKLPVPLTYP